MRSGSHELYESAIGEGEGMAVEMGEQGEGCACRYSQAR